MGVKCRRTRRHPLAVNVSGLAQLGDQLEKGARLYMKLHAKELGNDTIRLIVRDSKRPGGPIAKAAAAELVAREKVEILTGVIFSPEGTLIRPLSRSKQTRAGIGDGTETRP